MNKIQSCWESRTKIFLDKNISRNYLDVDNKIEEKMFNSENYVRTAVDRIGGPTRASNLVGASNATIHAWIKNGRITNIDKARIIAKAAGMEVQMLRGTR
ncbi:hypothetical protein [Burkholderia sp. BCC1640]|uniref:hypothetical protein n=1 Tax=Burkholderia sp. BCC1640 TaxID=2676294 RepID=UPI00158959AD|nr:hypothetical protein [Burkholderia sp. BCC1640]